MQPSVSRRNFVKSSLTAGTALSLSPGISILQGSPAQKITVAIMGIRSRGRALAQVFASQPDCEIAYLCEVDDRYVAPVLAEVAQHQPRVPKVEKDLRKVLEDASLDAFVIAAPDHWHAPAAIMACQAGKHVYVEKPCSHSPEEGEWLVAAARKYNRLVQMGNQRRSWPNTVACIQAVHEGAIGKVYYARGWYANRRQGIGFGREVTPPPELDFELWQGPAPRRPFRDNLHPYNWHWFWHWGTGEALNNGTHFVDLMRWGLNVDFPTRVTSHGGRYHYQDDWETPDTHLIQFDFEGGKSMAWESRSCNGHPEFGSSTGVVFYGETGTAIIHGNDHCFLHENNAERSLVRAWKQEDAASEITTVGPGAYFDAPHVDNFLQAIRDGRHLRSEVSGGHKSTLLCQLGNIAYRTGRSLAIDPGNGHILGDKGAMNLWGRSYEPGWRPSV